MRVHDNHNARAIKRFFGQDIEQKHVWNRKYLIVNFTVDFVGIKDEPNSTNNNNNHVNGGGSLLR